VVVDRGGLKKIPDTIVDVWQTTPVVALVEFGYTVLTQEHLLDMFPHVVGVAGVTPDCEHVGRQHVVPDHQDLIDQQVGQLVVDVNLGLARLSGPIAAPAEGLVDRHGNRP